MDKSLPQNRSKESPAPRTDRHGETRVALHNLGCKVNAYELDRIAASLVQRGYRIVPFSGEADIYIVNTCTVTNIADRKSRQMLHRAKKNNPDALVVALGCYVDTDAAGIGRDPCIDLALGNKDKAQLAEILDRHTAAASCGKGAANAAYRSRTRGYLKIQDGCNLFCSYCIIPYARGRSVSRLTEDVLREAREMEREGIREIVLTGIHLSSYAPADGFPAEGDDARTAGQGEDALARLVLLLNELPGIRRIRLGSLEPRAVTPESVRMLARADKLCPHFHLSLQSGSDAVLARMRRRYTTAQFAESVRLLRGAFSSPAITTDIITGFPGETEDEFEESRAFIDRMDFYETHVFPFSARKGTPAEGMEGQLTQKEKAARADVLIRLSKEKARAYRARFLGTEAEVLWEEEETIAGKKYLTGHTERYVKAAVPIHAGPPGAEGEKTDGTRSVRAGDLGRIAAESFLTEEILTGTPLTQGANHDRIGEPEKR